MKSINFVILGDSSVANELGKKGSVTDMTFYERKSSDKIFSFIVPSSFPEKIQPLVQSIALAEYAIVNVSNIDKTLGEQIVALDTMQIKNGFPHLKIVAPAASRSGILRLSEENVRLKLDGVISSLELKQNNYNQKTKFVKFSN